MPNSDPLEIRRLSIDELAPVLSLNKMIFQEERLINSFDHKLIISLLAMVGSEPVGFKIGYSLDSTSFYSAKGGVLPNYRRDGIARKLLYRMMSEAANEGFVTFCFDTFPNLYKPMLILGLNEGFSVVSSKWNETYEDFELRMSRPITKSSRIENR